MSNSISDHAATELGNNIAKLEATSMLLESFFSSVSGEEDLSVESFAIETSPVTDAAESLLDALNDAADAGEEVSGYSVDYAQLLAGDALGFQESGQEAANAHGEVIDALRSQVAQTLSDTIGQLQTRLNKVADNTSEELDSVGADIRGRCDSVQGELSDTLRNAEGEFRDRLAADISQPLKELLADSEMRFNSRMDDLQLMSMTRIRESKSAIEAKLNGLVTDMRGAGEASLNTAGQALKDAIVERLARTIADAIVKSNLSITLTSTMAPALPTMSAIKLGADSLLDVIEAWKAAKAGV